MPLGYDPFDFRRYLPPEASMYTLPVSAAGPSTFASPVPTAPDMPPRRVTTTPFDPNGQPIVPPIVTPGSDASTPLAPGSVDPRMVPMSRKVPEVRVPIVGPTGEPKTPDERLVPTPASTAPPPDTNLEKFKKAIEHKDFTGAAKALAAAFPKPDANKLQPYRMSGSSGGGGGVKDMSGSGSALLASLMKERKGNALIGGDLGKKQKKARQDDPHEYEQERFDWRRRSRR